jgi:hypothetical protein
MAREGVGEEACVLNLDDLAFGGMSCVKGDGERFEARADDRECNVTQFLAAADVGTAWRTLSSGSRAKSGSWIG